MCGCFGRILPGGHTAQEKEECRGFISKERKVLRAGGPVGCAIKIPGKPGCEREPYLFKRKAPV